MVRLDLRPRRKLGGGGEVRRNVERSGVRRLAALERLVGGAEGIRCCPRAVAGALRGVPA